MNRVWAGVAVSVALLALIVLFPTSETTFEFDCMNMRLRSCSRTRSQFLGSVLQERCGQPEEHPTAIRLRALGALPPVDANKERWVLIKGFKPGVSGWIGEGHSCLSALGPTTFGTAVPFPVNSDRTPNVWVRWAVENPGAAKEFWQDYQEGIAGRRHVGRYLTAAAEYLHNHESASASDVDAIAHPMLQPSE